MSEPMVKQRLTVDLDDFERRVRQAPHQYNDDPLAELARLVGEQHDPYGDVFAHERLGRDQAQQDHHGAADHPSVASTRLYGDFAAIEAGLRSSVGPNAEATAPAVGMMYADQHFHDQPSDRYDVPAPENEWAERRPAEAFAVSRRPVVAVAATIAIGVLGIGAAFALKGHVSSSPREIRTIMADAGPTKIQPPVDTSADASNADANIMGKGTQVTPTSLVSHEEQPVDLAKAVQDNAARDAKEAASAAPDASTVPVPPSPGQMQTAMAEPQGAAGQGDAVGQQVQKFGLSDMPAPKHVKVVSVRPDGTIMPDAQPAADDAARPVANRTSEHEGSLARSSSPRNSAGKSTSRVSTTPKAAEAPRSIDSLAAGDDATAAPVSTKKAKPLRLASAEPEQTETGRTEASRTEAAGTGGFAVQLAAPGSESDAKAASSRLGRKYASALAGHHLGFHKAESNGRSVYRVRVSSLSRSEAVSLCEKLKSEGGSCFVAKN